MTALESENADAIRLRKAVEFMNHCREAENQARRDLAEAVKRSAFAKQKHETLFAECEERAGQRRRSGQIENSSQY